MLTTTKNTLLNKVLRLEIDFNEALPPDIDNYILVRGWNYNPFTIIQDNLTSIKKQLKKL